MPNHCIFIAESPSALKHPEYSEQWFSALELLLNTSELLYKPLGLLGKPLEKCEFHELKRMSRIL